MFNGKYDKKRWNGRDVNEVFKNLGEEKANEIYEQKIAEGMSDDDAWLEVYSMECQMDNE